MAEESILQSIQKAEIENNRRAYMDSRAATGNAFAAALQPRAQQFYGFDPNIVRRGTLLPFGRTATGDLELALPQSIVDLLTSFLLPGHVVQGGRYAPEDATAFAMNFLAPATGRAAHPAAGSSGRRSSEAAVGEAVRPVQMPEITIGGRKLTLTQAREISRAEKLDDRPFLVFDARNQSGYEGIFPTEQEAVQFIRSHPNKRFLDYGTPRELEELNPSGEESVEYMMQQINDLIQRARTANQDFQR